jgi:hypothetical protein
LNRFQLTTMDMAATMVPIVGLSHAFSFETICGELDLDLGEKQWTYSCDPLNNSHDTFTEDYQCEQAHSLHQVCSFECGNLPVGGNRDVCGDLENSKHVEASVCQTP